ncbi:MAG: hypothetical protein SPI25_01780 [Dialister sp.]|nr:hypothetical protein [Dialister sp.]
MFSIGGSMGGGEDMMNVGLSLKVGRRSEYAGYSKAALTSVISQQKEQIANLTTEVAGQKQENQELKAQVQNQKAQITSQQKQIEDILQRLETLKNNQVVKNRR